MRQRQAVHEFLRRPWTRAVLSTVAGLVLLALFVRSVPIADLAAHVRPQHLWPLGALVGLVIAAQLIRAARWRWLLAPLASVRMSDAFCINAASGFLNYVIPVRAGEAVRVVWLARRHRVPAGTAVGCMVLDHTYDLTGVIAVLATGAVLSVTAGAGMPALPALLVALAGAVAMLALIAGTAAFGPRVATAPWLPAPLACRIAHHADAFGVATRIACTPGRLLLLTPASAAAVLADGLAFAMLLRSLGLAVSMVAAVVAQVTMLYAYLLPAAPGYVGSLEAAGTLILSRGLGLGAAPAASAMLLWHAAVAAVILGIGGIALIAVRDQFSPAPDPIR